ncbi:MAG: 5-methyltetrahydrofolate--homocysteine methyltransferase [Ruminiclostridium sp.]|nr:5-methyltetrahydrofolate--homocysteine methyltransferase [Ruminiclostridium sp.]
MDIKKEALRYVGYKGEPDEQTLTLLLKAEKELLSSAQPAFCWRVMDKSECISILTGNDIQKHLSGCEKIILFAATLGANADRVIRTAEISNMAYALIADAYASAMIEDYCDRCEQEMNEKTGGNYTWRFSPGYGDYPISKQSEFVSILSADKHIGLTVTDNHILIPRKSVTAVIGITDVKRDENRNKCESCNMKNTCVLRKDGTDCGR